MENLIDIILPYLSALIIAMTELIKRIFPGINSRIATVIVWAFLALIVYLFQDLVNWLFIFGSLFIAAGGYSLILQPLIVDPIKNWLDRRKRRF